MKYKCPQCHTNFESNGSFIVCPECLLQLDPHQTKGVMTLNEDKKEEGLSDDH